MHMKFEITVERDDTAQATRGVFQRLADAFGPRVQSSVNPDFGDSSAERIPAAPIADTVNIEAEVKPARKPRAKADPVAAYVEAGGKMPDEPKVANHSDSAETTRAYTAEEIASAMKPGPMTTTIETEVAKVEAAVVPPEPEPVVEPVQDIAALHLAMRARVRANGMVWGHKLFTRLGVTKVSDMTLAHLAEAAKEPDADKPEPM